MFILFRLHRAAVCAALGAFCTFAAAPGANADSPARQASNFASGSGNIIYLAAAVGLPLLSDGGRHGTSHALRAADAIGTSTLLCDGLKDLFREKRPDSNSHDSFPSGHATAAFAAATVESDLHPHETALWFTGATLISYSRIRLHRHYGRDVIAGALLGYGTARLELSAPRGLLLSPIIQPESRRVGLQLTLPLR